MKLRIVTGSIVASIVLGLIFYGPQWAVLVAVCLAGLAAYWEFDHLFIENTSIRRQAMMSVLILWTFVSLNRGGDSAIGALLMCFVLLGVGGVIQGYFKKDLKVVASRVSAMVTGYIYTVCVAGMILPIVSAYGRGALLYLFFVVFVGDTTAYFFGRTFGKHKLARRISPGKSIEGSVAAFTSALVISFLVHRYSSEFSMFEFFQTIELWKLLLFSLLLSLFAQIGDLFESVMKRSQGEKDSGTLLPGHGGILDRIDGLAFAAPMFYVLFGLL